MVSARSWRRGTLAAALLLPLTVAVAPGALAAPALPAADGYPAPPESSVALAVKSPECDGNVPYLRYAVDVSKDPSATAVDLTWTSLDGSHSQTVKNLPVSGKVLWLGAEEAGGRPTAWPGWVFKNGTWEEGGPFTWVRPDVKVSFVVHDDAFAKTSTQSSPTIGDGVYRPQAAAATVRSSALVLPAANTVSSVVSYPPATTACADPATKVLAVGGVSGTTGGRSLAMTGASIAPFALAALALLAIGGTLVVVGRRHRRLPD